MLGLSAYSKIVQFLTNKLTQTGEVELQEIVKYENNSDANGHNAEKCEDCIGIVEDGDGLVTSTT